MSDQKSPANHTVSGKPLDPNASPYRKIIRQPLYLYLFSPPPPRPPPPPTYNLIPPLPYNIKLQPFPSPKSFTKPLTKNSSLIPVPTGPRIPKSHLLRRHRLKIKALPSDVNGKGMKWIPKFHPENKPAVEKQGAGKRWKNSRREYQKSLPLEKDTTSLMIKNIPNKYTRHLLIQTLDIHCKHENQMKEKNEKDYVASAFDFLYLPIDFNCRVNAGFAFVNFTTPEAALRFRDAFNGKRWDLFDSSKVAEISRARIQGKRDLVNNCKGMDFTYGSDEDMPVWFEPARDGSGEVVSKMFAVGKWLN